MGSRAAVAVFLNCKDGVVALADLIAEGAKPQDRWRRNLPEGQQLLVGRAAGIWSVPWDDHVSRRHAELCFNGGRLAVERLPNALNPIFVRGVERDRFDMEPGDHFVIGKTRFTLTDDKAEVSLAIPQPVREQAYSSQYLHHVPFRNADQRIEVLSRLPEMISGSANDSELYVRLVNLLLVGLARASAVALVEVDKTGNDDSKVEVLHWDRRFSGGSFLPSQRLILRATKRGQSMLHVWGTGESEASITALTVDEHFDWAFCVPTRSTGPSMLAIYVAGTFADEHGPTPTPSDPADLRDDLKFTELVASIVGSLRSVHQLQRRHASLSQFFAPAVLDALAAEDDPEVALTPRETHVTVMFCDLRGFSLNAEQSRDDLLGLLNRVSAALGVMTHHILEQGGVIGDYQGDSAMGFWGWPLSQEDAVERAVRASLAIRKHFEEVSSGADRDAFHFEVGIGIATGPAVAGKIGTLEQVKVTVFGPVVNLASRLESMTKMLNVPILVDEATAERLRNMPREEARCRRMAVVKPYGLHTPLTVSEVVPPLAQLPEVTDEHLASYEAAVDALIAGQWDETYRQLHRIPPEDRAKDFLTVFVARHNRKPPSDWPGYITLTTK